MTRIPDAMHPRHAMRLPCTLLLLLLFCAFPASGQSGSRSHVSSEGRKVFKEKKCDQCHTVRGEGRRRGPDLGVSHYYGTYLEFAALMWNHLPKMADTMEEIGTGFPEFTPEEMQALIVYLAYQRYKEEEGSNFAGRKLLRSNKCFSCHRFGGEGGEIGPDISKLGEYLSPLRLVEAMWNHGPQMMDLFEKNGIPRPELNSREIIDMAVAIRSYLPATNHASIYAYDMGNPIVGAQLVADKGCFTCHAESSKSAQGGPPFRKMKFDCSVTEMAARMWNHGKVMWTAMKKRGLSNPTFDTNEIADVLAYLYSLQFEDNPGRADAGYSTIVSKQCLSCHENNKSSGNIAVSFSRLQGMNSPLAMITKMWNHAPKMRKKQIERKFKWSELSGREMADMYAYFKKINK